ncbi:MAG: M15 family metallopeptidase [Spirochaetaceae bacterium]|jgi:hypothetical protein|nr:M15 family metallopeptidase [Spirochaetaceae bacterium]
MKRENSFLLVLLFGNGLLSAQQLYEYSLDNFDKVVIADEGFETYLYTMDRLAAQYNLQIKVQGEGFRQADSPVKAAIVPPSATSNHLVGHAVDVNIVYNGTWYNSSALGNYSSLPQAIKSFITGCKNAGMRWGGELSTPDPVHFDDGLHLRNKTQYDTLYLLYQ